MLEGFSLQTRMLRLLPMLTVNCQLPATVICVGQPDEDPRYRKMGEKSGTLSWRRCSAALALVMAANAGLVIAGEELKQRLLREAPTAWSELHRRAMEYEGKAKRKGEPTVGVALQTSKGFSCDYRFRGDGESFLVESECREGEIWTSHIACMNGDYGFRLKRMKERGAWSVSGLDRELPAMMEVVEMQGKVVFLSVGLDMQTLEWSFKQPNFRVVSVSPVEKDGRTVAEMSFTSETFFRPDYQIRSGTVLLDPERSWAVLGYSIDVMLDVPAKVDAEVTYAADGSNFPIPVRYVHIFRATLPEGPLERRETVDFSDVKKCGASPEEFRLTAFGFPEPAPSTASDGDRRWYALIAAAAVFLAAAVGLRAWANRRRPAR